jgi:hypothetical protein
MHAQKNLALQTALIPNQGIATGILSGLMTELHWLSLK